MIFLSQYEWQSKAGILGAELARHTPKRAFGGRDEIIFLVMSVAVLHGAVNIALSSSSLQAPDSTISVGETGRLSQTAQRSASGA